MLLDNHKVNIYSFLGVFFLSLSLLVLKNQSRKIVLFSRVNLNKNGALLESGDSHLGKIKNSKFVLSNFWAE